VPLPPVRNRIDISKQLEENKKKMQEKEAKAKSKTAPKQADPNDIFTEKDIHVQGEKKEEVKYKRDVTPMPDYYKAWDRFNVDDALDSDEENKNTNKITYKEPEAPRS
jgi:hypothetical protein